MRRSTLATGSSNEYDQLIKFRGCNKAIHNGRPIIVRQARRGQPKGTYLCPGCRNPVFAANLSSTAIAPCFKHYEEPEDCQRYFGGIFVDEFDSDAPPLALRFVLDVDASQAQSWRLFLQLPPATYAEGGTVQAYTGPSVGIVEIKLRRLEETSVDVAIAPCFEPYRVDRVHGDDAQDYVDAFDPRKRSVALRNPVTPFDVTNTGRSGQVEGQLYWSRSYYLIHGAGVVIPEALRPELASQKLDRRYEDWRCSRVALPREPTEALRLWLAASIGLPITAPPARATVIYPFTMGLYNATLRATSVPSTARALIAIEQPSRNVTEMHCAVEQDAHVVAHPLPAALVSFADVRAPDATNLPLCIGVDEDPDSAWYPLATLTATTHMRSPSKVAFEFEGQAALGCHEPGLDALFANARRDGIAIVAILNPQNIAMTLETRSFCGERWVEQTFVSDDGGIGHLNDLLRNPDLDLRLCVAGMFSVQLPAAASVCEPEVALPKSDPFLGRHRRLSYAQGRRGHSHVLERADTFDNHIAGVRTRAGAGRGVRTQ